MWMAAPLMTTMGPVYGYANRLMNIMSIRPLVSQMGMTHNEPGEEIGSVRAAGERQPGGKAIRLRYTAVRPCRQRRAAGSTGDDVG